MDNNAALRPNSLGEFASLESQTEIPVTPPAPDVEDQALNFIGNSQGWEIVNKYIDDLEGELSNMLRVVMATKDVTFTEIGQRAMVKEAVVEYLEKVRAKVTDAMEAVQNAESR